MHGLGICYLGTTFTPRDDLFARYWNSEGGHSHTTVVWVIPDDVARLTDRLRSKHVGPLTRIYRYYTAAR